MKKRKILLVALGLCIVMSGCSVSGGTQNASNDAATESSELGEVGTGDTYDNSEADGHAISASNETVSYDNVSVTKSGDSEGGDEADFYGTNAAVYAEEGANLTITNSKISTSGSHANAVFSYGEGTEVNISDSVIETSENNSGGIMVTGGGTLNASNLQVTTQNGSSAAIRSDRGGGTMNVEGGTYTSYGLGSPAIYSTAEVNVKDATLYSDISQAVVVEGMNSVSLENVDATGNHTKQNSDKTDACQAVMIYQSMSGDANEGEGKFSMKDGSLTSMNGGMFYVTNTVASIDLENVTMNYATDDLLRIEKAGWGNDGSNGGQVNFNASSQELKGEITVDDISKLNLYLKDGSNFEGMISSEGETYVEISDDSVWKLTGDSSITSLTCDADAIDLNGYTLTVDGKEYVAGTASEGTALEFTYPEGGQGGPGGEAPEGMTPPDGQGAPDGQAPDGGNPPEGGKGPGSSDGSAPDGKNPPDGKGAPDGKTPPDAKTSSN